MDFDILTQLVKEVFSRMGFAEEMREVEVHQGATTRISVRVSDSQEYDSQSDGFRVSPTNLLIGEKGGNLNALEYVIKRIAQRRYENTHKFTLDINDYRIKRLDDLKQDVKVAAKEVRLYRHEVALNPMSSFERRIVHLLLAEYPDITTISVGSEPNRMVVIKPFP